MWASLKRIFVPTSHLPFLHSRNKNLKKRFMRYDFKTSLRYFTLNYNLRPSNDHKLLQTVFLRAFVINSSSLNGSRTFVLNFFLNASDEILCRRNIWVVYYFPWHLSLDPWAVRHKNLGPSRKKKNQFSLISLNRFVCHYFF